MRTISFLLLILVFCQLSFGYTVILKSGKKMEGTWIGEDSFTLQMKDNTGILLSFRKSVLDLEAMKTVNESSHPETLPVQETTIRWGKAESEKPSLVELAQETKKKRGVPSRTLTLGDLRDAPELSVLGSDGPAFATVESTPVPREDEWRSASRALRKDLDSLRDRKISAGAACSKAREKLATKLSKPHRNSVNLLPLFEDPAECLRASEIDRQLRDAERRWEEHEDRARKAEVPWQWLE